MEPVTGKNELFKPFSLGWRERRRIKPKFSENGEMAIHPVEQLVDIGRRQ
jgi:hypothetical protein